MASKKLIEKVARAMLDAERKSMDLPHRVFHTPADRESVAPLAEAAISTILAALQDPNAEMINALWSVNSSRGWPEAAKICWQYAINASPLGEQSDRAEIISADGAIWYETAPGTRNFKRREQSE